MALRGQRWRSIFYHLLPTGIQRLRTRVNGFAAWIRPAGAWMGSAVVWMLFGNVSHPGPSPCSCDNTMIAAAWRLLFSTCCISTAQVISQRGFSYHVLWRLITLTPLSPTTRSYSVIHHLTCKCYRRHHQFNVCIQWLPDIMVNDGLIHPDAPTIIYVCSFRPCRKETIKSDIFWNFIVKRCSILYPLNPRSVLLKRYLSSRSYVVRLQYASGIYISQILPLL